MGEPCNTYTDKLDLRVSQTVSIALFTSQHSAIYKRNNNTLVGGFVFFVKIFI